MFKKICYSPCDFEQLGQADRLLFFIRGHGLKELPPTSGRDQELVIRA